MNAAALFARRTPYLGWTAFSALGLALACWMDPYIFGFAVMASLWLSGGLVLASLLLAWRQLGWALLAALPTGIALAVLSTYSWA